MLSMPDTSRIPYGGDLLRDVNELRLPQGLGAIACIERGATYLTDDTTPSQEDTMFEPVSPEDVFSLN